MTANMCETFALFDDQHHCSSSVMIWNYMYLSWWHLVDMVMFALWPLWYIMQFKILFS